MSDKLYEYNEPWSARQRMANVWAIEVPCDGYIPVSVASVQTTVCDVGCGSDEDTARRANRIVNSVNACAGLSDEEEATLGTGGVKELVDDIAAAILPVVQFLDFLEAVVERKTDRETSEHMSIASVGSGGGSASLYVGDLRPLRRILDRLPKEQP